MKRVALGVLALLVVATAVFVYAPLGALDPPDRDSATLADFEARGEEHFEKVLAGQDLDRPFPAMRTRAANPTTPSKVELGRLLYFDPILSGDNTVSCAHCHHPDLGFSDGRGRSMGKGGTGLADQRAGGAVLRRGAPTVWNSAFNHLQFWDGRARDLEEQAGKPIQDAAEMAQDPDELVTELAAIPEYVEHFATAFDTADSDPSTAVSFERVTFALAAFERTLVSNNSAFDRYARGDRQALSRQERRGLNIFRSLATRCFECHNLPTFANPDFKVIGVPDPDDLEAPDLGRAEIAGGDAYARAFKVPTLRNVALTAPYMHNGAFDSLEDVIDFYARGGGHGEGLELSNLDDKIRPFALTGEGKGDLIAFLEALTDESAKPAIPDAVPSGLPVVEALGAEATEEANGSVDVVAAAEAAIEAPTVRRDGTRLLVEPGPGQPIQAAIDLAQPGDIVEVAPGVYDETLTLDLSGITLRGLVGPNGERAVLDGKNQRMDGMIGSGSDLVIEGFAIRNYTANGVMINLGRDVVFRDLHLDNTGLYGIYPVEVVGVLVEDSSVTGVRDAGIYVGQSKNIVVRRNVAHGNVTGIEIENSLSALVEDNDVYDNAGGILVFGLPNVPSKVARGCRVVGNRVTDNNHENFGDPSAVVSAVPSGTGIMILAADEVEVTGNTITGNNSFGIAVAGLDALFEPGSTYDIDPFPDGVHIQGNTMAENGAAPDPKVVDAGYTGADLLWDLSGEGHTWDQPGASRLPYALPASSWGETRRRANRRLWALLSKLTG